MTHATSEQLVAYWADEPTDETLEDHLFACDACTRESERIARIVQAFRTSIPPVVSRADVDALRARGTAIRENAFAPGVRTPARFERGVDLLVHRLAGLDLHAAERVDVTVRTESGQTLFVDAFAPFDRDRGEVLIACQRHFEAFGDPNVAFDVQIHTGERTTLATYLIPHEFA